MMKRLVTTAITGLFVAAVAVLAAGCGGGSASGEAPAFSSSELASLPTKNWITNGGTISNQRYSPLSRSTRGMSVASRAIWHIHLRSGTAGKYSGEAQPIVYNERDLRRHGRRRRLRDRRDDRGEEVDRTAHT